VPLGRLAGIPVYVHASFLLLAGLIALEETQPHSLGVVDATLWVIAIFACVVVHELAHSILARRKGATVRSIILLPIGGVSQIEGMPEFWGDELEVAAAGPLASIGLAVLAGVAAVATGRHLTPVTIYGGAFLPRLAWANLLLGGFNLLPAFPLDGGRVLRAALERRHDVMTATRWAAQVGRLLAGTMVVAGLFWNLWLVFIGAFVWFGATMEEQSTVVHTRLSHRLVRQFMRAPVTTIDARLQLGDLAGIWPGPQVVTVDGRYLGLVLGSEIQAAPSALTAGDITDRDVPTVGPDDDLGRSALDKLMESSYGLLAVVDDNAEVVGVLLKEDVAHWLDRPVATGPR
jgi:Zn-dependent protease